MKDDPCKRYPRLTPTRKGDTLTDRVAFTVALVVLFVVLWLS